MIVCLRYLLHHHKPYLLCYKFSFSQQQPYHKLKLQELCKTLVLHLHRYKVSTIVKLLHSATMMKEQNKIEFDYEEKKLIYKTINAELYQINHEQLNQLLQIFQQSNSYFDRDNQTWRIIYRLMMKGVFTNRLKGQYVLKTMLLFKNLKFPKKGIEFYTDLITSNQSIILTDVQPTIILKLGMVLIQNNTSKPIQIKSIVQKIISFKYQKMNELAYLYHFSTILPKFLAKRIENQAMQIAAQHILWDPQLNTYQQYQGRKGQDKGIFRKQIEQILQLFDSVLNVNKIADTIAQKILSNLQDIDLKQLILIAPIVQLRGFLHERIIANLDQIRPIQFMIMLKYVEQGLFEQLMQSYVKCNQELLSLQEYVYVRLEGKRIGNIPITIHHIEKLLQSMQSINMKQFALILELIQKIPNDQQKQISTLINQLNKLVQFE